MTEAAKQILHWRNNPVDFVKDNFGVEPDAWQAEALNEFVSGNNRIALSACSGPGKSAVLAWIGWLFLSCFGDIGEHPKGACISVTQENLRDNLWAEFSKWQSRSEFLMREFIWTKSQIQSVRYPNTWFLSARSFPKSASKEDIGKTLSGIHSEYVLFLIDECGSIPVEVSKAAEQALSNCKFGKIVMAGNPLTHDGMLYASTRNPNYKTIFITGDPDNPKRSKRIDIVWARSQIDLYGRDDPWVRSYILGLFPLQAVNSLISYAEVETAMNRDVTEDYYKHSQKRIGVDVARFGADSTVLFPRQGLAAFRYIEMREQRTPDIAARVMLAKKRWGSDMEFIDGTGGFGAGVIDSLMQAGVNAYEVNFSSKAIDSRYYNKRAEMWFSMAEWIRRGGKLPKCNILSKELTAPTYSFRNGKFILEDKDQIKRRLGFSTDRADALALTFSVPEFLDQNSTLSQVPSLIGLGCLAHEWDPFA